MTVARPVPVRMPRGPRIVVRTAFLRGFLAGLWASAGLYVLLSVLPWVLH